MECGICCEKGKHLFCETCVGERIRLFRYEILKLLTKKERAATEVRRWVEAEEAGGARRREAEGEEVGRRTGEVRVVVERERERVGQARARVRAKREDITAREKQLRDAKEYQKTQRSREVDKAAASIVIARARLDTALTDLAEQRHCEIADLACIMRLTKSTFANGTFFFLAGLEIPDLRELRKFDALHLTTVLSHISHVIWLTASYLSVKLPHAIVLPNLVVHDPGVYIRRDWSTSGRSRLPMHVEQDIATMDISVVERFVEGTSCLASCAAYLGWTQHTFSGEAADTLNLGQVLYDLFTTTNEKKGLWTHDAGHISKAAHGDGEIWTMDVDSIARKTMRALKRGGAEWHVVDERDEVGDEVGDDWDEVDGSGDLN
ncbi:hypothetical protein SAICODRAFT_162966 [Saitoella complicata NRRL Y-17804]|uniref:Autophagy-related protein 14 n=1 Tax=Saitoella complicata (strain BCRC 22490 / CBS 7301 / JCM 7358 / NBRC 10748 / NRRL Y-17804) TaxID=698492 RepID=A0A0E9NN67_SAICN|nr:uncharacterized protein SAICODRAFT_162966 [Saitoella complicata NRRL Y-17804]ODQ51109.1 hypothetical protein SAICODRAFT_162966 [Saitoella complicata NRRL Y-17804]GAO51279.1 hypothetical protein G7K_5385-t1 [Saitoella complicata NRRL Y-17804]